jgi:hypothetical protein
MGNGFRCDDETDQALSTKIFPAVRQAERTRPRSGYYSLRLSDVAVQRAGVKSFASGQLREIERQVAQRIAAKKSAMAMSIYDDICLIDELNALGIEYVLVGSVAASFYGLTRATVDADFVVELKSHKLADIVQRMGSGYGLESQARFEIFTDKQVNVINVLGEHLTIDVFPLTDDPFDQMRFARRLKIEADRRSLFIPTVEDIVVMKIRWRRPLDLEDARYVISLHEQSLDWAYVEQWCDAHGTRQTLAEVRRSIPPRK